jgi:hypothetical protein
LTPEAKKPMPAGAESLAALLVEHVRRYERNCRCPKCHEQTLMCVDCDFCIVNLQKLVLGEITNPAATFFSCVEERIGGNLTSMKTSTSKLKAKKAKKLGAKVKITHSDVRKKPSAKARAVKAKIHGTRAEKPVSIASGRRKGGDSDRGLYVRFENPTVKALVKAAADKTGVAMNSYIVAATLDWVAKSKELANPKDAAAAERVIAAG